MYTIRKEFNFSASHQVLGLPETHPCSRVHGHNYKVIVELRSNRLTNTGFVKDYRELNFIKEYLNNTLDHVHLNAILIMNPTAENIAYHLFYVFHDALPDLYAVEVQETDKTSARFELNR